MKKIIILVTVLFGFNCWINSQIKLDIGRDTILCVAKMQSDTFTLGGNPTASGGESPYRYFWSCIDKESFIKFTSNYFLNDSTHSNPKLINPLLSGVLIVKLKVIDNVGAIAEDSVKIRFSNFNYLSSECRYDINKGDTVSLWSTIGGGIEPLQYEWTPNSGISDVQISNPKVWPLSNITYQLLVRDSVGCVSEPAMCSISVNTLDLNTDIFNESLCQIYPNPTVDILHIKSMKAISLRVINTEGKVMDVVKMTNNHLEYKLNVSNYPSGMYFVSADGESQHSLRFIKQ